MAKISAQTRISASANEELVVKPIRASSTTVMTPAGEQGVGASVEEATHPGDDQAAEDLRTGDAAAASPATPYAVGSP